MTFSFDDRYAMFDVTPVENQFILEFLPEAPGDNIKVYLYGLMRCYHADPDLTTERMSRELNMPEEAILKAYRYWERRGLVRRISDHPPAWKYVNLHKVFTGESNPTDPEYDQFAESLYDVFDNGRRLHGAEIQTCFEWVEELKLPREAVIMLLKHMARVKGKDFTIQSADRIAAKMADEKISTVEEAEAFLSRDVKTYEAVRRILRKLGKRGYPSEAQLDLYRKWRDEWHFSDEAIEKACAMTAKGEPNMGYLDGILNGLRRSLPESDAITAADITEDQELGERLREVLNALESGTAITPESKALMTEIGKMYPQQVILIGARECARNGKGLADLKKLLQAWQEKGLKTESDVRAYVNEFHAKNELLKKLRELWNGDEPKLGEAGRKAVTKWKEEWGFSEEMILKTAEYAAEAKKPMAYLDKILSVYRDQGIRTPEEAEKARQRFLEKAGAERKVTGGKTVTAQEYEQRDYSGTDKEMLDLFIRMNGGEPDA